MSTGHTHDDQDHDHDHGHEHPAAPMVEEITDYEVLEIAVRELAIEHGLFTAEDHRRFTERAESVGPMHDRCRPAAAWPNGGRSPDPQSPPSGPILGAAWERRRMSVTSDGGLGRIGLLEGIRRQGKEWDVLAPRYGVTNPHPPWKTSLIGTNEGLAAGGVLPALERRKAEDELGDAVYRDVPAPERELLALVHTMLRRGLVTEGELARRMHTVRSRLEAV